MKIKKPDIVKGNNTQEEQVLEYMREHPRVTRAEIEKLLNVKTTLAYSILKSLECQGKIKTEKNGKSTVYTLA